MAGQIQRFIDHLTFDHRVVLLGGVAIIAHGRERHTRDADIWLEPMDSAETWAGILRGACQSFPDATIHRLPGWKEISVDEIAAAAEETGMVRVLGLGDPVDVFRRPNEFDVSDFEEVAGRATRNADGTLLPEPLDLLQSKIATNRDKDREDVRHLEDIVRGRYVRLLPAASLEEASALLDRFSDWRVLRAALENPDTGVRELARTQLREFAEAGDPFSQAILEGREIPE